jgi:PilZ domain
VAEIALEGSYVGCGISRDASTAGLLLLTHVDLAPGSAVLVRLRVPGEDSPRILGASVVRREKLPPGQSPIWTHTVAISFDQPPDDLEQILGDLTVQHHGTK